jgi:hypothetical protein
MLVMRILFLCLLLIGSLPIFSQVDCAPKCKSEVLRVEVSPKVLSERGLDALLPSLQNFSQSDLLHSLIEKQYTLPAVDFPSKKDVCLRRKSENDPAFKKIDCESKTLCSDQNVSREVRDKICFQLPCPIFEGNLNVGKCNNVAYISPTKIEFPKPVSVNNIELEPTDVGIKGNDARLCFKVKALDVTTAITLNLNTQGTSLPDKSITVDNVHPVLDSPKQACIIAKIDLNSKTPISKLTITTPTGEPFISDDMIRAATKELKFSGLSGYSPQDLAQVQNEVVPVLIQPVRESIESAVKGALGQVFEEELNKRAKGVGSKVIPLDATAYTSELGVANLLIKDQVDRVECAAYQAVKKTPPNPCDFGNYIGGDKITAGPTINELMGLQELAKNKNITSESTKQRLMALGALMQEEDWCCYMDNESAADKAKDRQIQKEINQRYYNQYIQPVVDQISANQLKEKIPGMFEVHNQIHASGRDIGLSMTSICTPVASPHEGKSMPGCPVQAYADLNEFNKLFANMWKSGALCMSGSGPFVGNTEGGWQHFEENGSGAPVALSGCKYEFSGMSCYLNSPPQIKYDSKTKKYRSQISFKGCYRGPVLMGLGKVGGDLNVEVAFKPAACDNGDFCVKDPEINWKVAPGTERFAFRPSSQLNSTVNDTINGLIKKTLSESIRIPLSNEAGAMANFPLESEGRVDAGPGYFGACLKPRNGSGASPK